MPKHQASPETPSAAPALPAFTAGCHAKPAAQPRRSAERSAGLAAAAGACHAPARGHRQSRRIADDPNEPARLAWRSVSSSRLVIATPARVPPLSARGEAESGRAHRRVGQRPGIRPLTRRSGVATANLAIEPMAPGDPAVEVHLARPTRNAQARARPGASPPANPDGGVREARYPLRPARFRCRSPTAARPGPARLPGEADDPGDIHVFNAGHSRPR